MHVFINVHALIVNGLVRSAEESQEELSPA
jgi:hypothetical protein